MFVGDVTENSWWRIGLGIGEGSVDRKTVMKSKRLCFCPKELTGQRLDP